MGSHLLVVIMLCKRRHATITRSAKGILSVGAGSKNSGNQVFDWLQIHANPDAFMTPSGHVFTPS
jgi:hypothetical protein